MIEDLLVWPERRSLTATPEVDAFTEPDALLEAALLDVKLDATTSSVWLLFDCRGAVQLEMGNTAVVVIHGVTGLQWRTEPKGAAHLAGSHGLASDGIRSRFFLHG